MNAFQNVIQNRFASARFNRLMFTLGAAILAAGVVTLVFTVVGGSDKRPSGPEAGFNPQLPVHSEPLKNANGRTIRTFWQLDPEVRTTIRTFIATAVARKNLDVSWSVTAPSVKAGYTFEQWKNAKALPIIPYPVDDVDKVQYYLDYASTKEILVEVGLAAKRSARLRPTTFQLGLLPVGKGANAHWLVDYWMPRWTPPLPTDQ
ncbi:MAG: hypothetical protein AABM30_08445 [Actinomycetota bacterium]